MHDLSILTKWQWGCLKNGKSIIRWYILGHSVEEFNLLLTLISPETAINLLPNPLTRAFRTMESMIYSNMWEHSKQVLVNKFSLFWNLMCKSLIEEAQEKKMKDGKGKGKGKAAATTLGAPKVVEEDVFAAFEFAKKDEDVVI